jgi:ABC-type nickel/cobalt efflux system permease component RcnA
LSRQPARLLLLLAGLGLAPAAFAHDIPNERVDRAIQVELAPGRLRIDYEVSLSELTLAKDLRNLVGPLPDSDRPALFRRYGEATGPLNARGFLVEVGGEPVELACRGFDLAVEEHPRYTFHLDAALPASGRLSVQDTNYVASEGTSRLALRSEPGLAVEGYDGPSNVDAVPLVPVWQLSDEAERATRQVAVSYRPAAAGSTAPARAAVAPSLPASAASPRPPGPASGLTRLLDHPGGASLAGLWLLALGLGAAHAIQPGHGKTLVAAATVGGRGGWGSGVALALITTAAHFAVVLALAAAIALTRSARSAAVHVALARGAGFAIACVGLWRLGRHLGGYPEHDAEPGAPGVGDRGLLTLGIAGGIVPCWDAVVLILLADLAGRLALGIVLLSGFSLGMAVVLVVVGALAGRVRGWLAPDDSDDRWPRRLGLASGLALTGIGLYLFLS